MSAMKCPICNQEMVVTDKSISRNFETGQKYNKITNHCLKDDVWIVMEIPLKGNN